LIEMVKAMLAERFQLKVRIESREVSGYALTVGKDGHKLKLKSPADSDQLPSLDFDASGQPIVRGRSTMEKFAQWLGGSFGFGGPANAPVVDRTGLSEVYDYAFDLFPRGAGGAGQRGGPASGQAQGDPAEEMRGIFFRSLENQLGLRLIPEKAIPVDVVVIDKVEMPSEN
jgi:uncharacterized protein (TIGR03435 family)